MLASRSSVMPAPLKPLNSSMRKVWRAVKYPSTLGVMSTLRMPCGSDKCHSSGCLVMAMVPFVSNHTLRVSSHLSVVNLTCLTKIGSNSRSRSMRPERHAAHVSRLLEPRGDISVSDSVASCHAKLVASVPLDSADAVADRCRHITATRTLCKAMHRLDMGC